MTWEKNALNVPERFTKKTGLVHIFVITAIKDFTLVPLEITKGLLCNYQRKKYGDDSGGEPPNDEIQLIAEGNK